MQRVDWVIGGLGLLAATLFALTWPAAGARSVPSWSDLLTFAILVFVGTLLAVQVNEHVMASVTFPVAYSAVILIGPWWGALVAMVSVVSVAELRGNMPLRAVLFNHFQQAVEFMAAGWTYQGLCQLWQPDPFSLLDALAMIGGGMVGLIVNVLLVSLVISLTSQARFFDTMEYNLSDTMRTTLVLVPLAYLMAAVFSRAGWMGLALFFLPLLIARQSFILYNQARAAYLQTIASLGAALEARDQYTAGHSRRVAEVAVRIGGKMGLSQRELEALRHAGLLHDVGKIGIDDRILKKPARFIPSEYEEMKRHPTIAQEILGIVPGMELVNQWATHHHERWDGSGYPDGLAGEEIPLGARILTVADSFDAMASRRIYKPSLAFAHVQEELDHGAGKQFDPRVVEAFFELMMDPGFRSWIEGELPDFQVPAPEELRTMRAVTAADEIAVTRSLTAPASGAASAIESASTGGSTHMPAADEPCRLKRKRNPHHD